MNAICNTRIPVLCDRCQASGTAGEGDFAHLGDLLDFEPVPRQLKRRNGWTGVLQREFIARLAQTGSPTLAVEAMTKCLHGVRKLLKDPGSDGFRAAWDRAVELGEAAEARRRIAEQAGIDARNAHADTPRSRGHAPEPESEADDTGLRMEMIERLIAKFQRKVAQERSCRLGGRIVEADFYLRQITCLEVAFDLMVDGHGDRGWTMLMEARRGTRNLLEIADTHMTRVLDQARRDQWAAMAEPERPEAWPERYLLGEPGKVDARIEPLAAAGKASRPAAGIDPGAWQLMDTEEQQRI
ncbi:MAG: hypothetical protein ACR2KH_06505 [Sphingomicrobium sp.]